MMGTFFIFFEARQNVIMPPAMFIPNVDIFWTNKKIAK